MNKMKKDALGKFFIGWLGLVISSIVFADNKTAPSLFQNIHLDQSQDVFFESFSPNTFSLELLQTKNKFQLRNLIIGGVAELDLQRWQGDRIAEYPLGQYYEDGNGLYFTQATLDLMYNLNPWSMAFVSASDIAIGVNNPNANYFYLPHAFVVLGDLDKFPLYSTLGINTISFGVFAGSGPWDSPLTYAYFNPAQAPQISVGYFKNNLNVVMTEYEDQTNYQYHSAFSIYYNDTIKNVGYNVGIGYISDLKLNSTQNALFQPKTLRNFPADIGDLGAVYDLNAGISYSQFAFSAEYDQGQYKINGNNNKPAAYALVASYTKEIKGQDTSFGLGYSRTLHLRDVPTSLSGYDNLVSAFHGLKDSYSLSVSRPLTKQVTLGITLQRATIYSSDLDTRIINHNQTHTYTATLDLLAYL